MIASTKGKGYIITVSICNWNKIIVTDTGIGIAPHKMGVFFVSSYLSRELQINKSDSDLMYFPFIPHAVLSTMY